jgi:hypothetical protein
MVLKARGELLSLTDKVVLTATFYDSLGSPVDTDTFPKVSLIQPSGTILSSLSSIGVQRITTGKYSYSYEIPYNGPLGVWNDLWQGTVAGKVQTQTLNFVVFQSNLYGVLSSDGYHQLGEDPGFDYSQIAILNINKLLKTLRARLNSSGKIEIIDPVTGNITYQDCDIFSADTLVTFLAASLTEFNAIPHFTSFNFNNTNTWDIFHSIVVEGAVIYALGSQALIERGREWQITDNGVAVNVPTVSELLNTQYSQLYTTHFEKLKLIKASMKPGPLGLGNLTTTSGSPLARRLSTLRARRLF